MSQTITSPPARYDALDLTGIDGMLLDGGRRRRRMVIATGVVLAVLFGSLFLALGLSYSS